MSIKHLSVGFALAALTVVLAPTTGQAETNKSHSQFQAKAHASAQRRARIERSQAYREKFQDMRMKRWKHKKRYTGDDLVGVPELDPSGIGAAATLLLGGVLVAQGRRRRLSFV
jgi:hypothetical protein